MFHSEYSLFLILLGVALLWIAKNILPGFFLSLYSSAAHHLLFWYAVIVISGFVQKYCMKWKIDAENKAVLITGCGSGFGKCLAQRFHKLGFRVFACCRDPSCQGARELLELCPERLQVIAMDVTDDRSVQKAFEEVTEALGGSSLWAVVNNAGVFRSFFIELTPVKVFNECFQTNALGSVRVTKSFLPLLRQSRGRVVNVCSQAGRIPNHCSSAYIMSKFGLVAFSEMMNLEMQDFGIQTISIEPEFFKTRMCTEEYLLSMIDTCLKDSNPDVQSEYGQRFIQEGKKCYSVLVQNSCPDLDIVLSDIEAGVCLRYPANVYNSCRNWMVTAGYYLGRKTGADVRALGVSIVFAALGLSSPRTASSKLKDVLRCLFEKPMTKLLK